MPRRTWPKHAFRVASLIVPSWLAWYVAFAAPHPDALTLAVKLALGPVWVLLMGALVLRTLGIVWGRNREAPVLTQLDVLTSSGAALAWLSALAIVGAVWLGWASLAVVGLLGTALFHIVVLFTFCVVRGSDPMRAGTITRRFVPAVVTEGDPVVEELRFAGPRIPLGFRLFATGRLGPRWAMSRHLLESAESGGEVVLESEIGPAIRGEHGIASIDVWLQDTFGLCRSMRVQVGAAPLTVLPRLRAAEKAAPLLEHGQGPRAPHASPRLPTEGHFNLREYQQGDDVRRIHWVRSLAARELIVRLPDELPPDRPRVRLVLDTFFPDAALLACDTPSEILDSLVDVWLAVGRALAESGARVTLVTALPDGAGVGKARQELTLRDPAPALRLGAKVVWQSEMTADALLTDEATFVISRAVLLPEAQHGNARWIVVLPTGISRDPPWTFTSGARLRYPVGASENRWSRRRREEQRIAVARRDRMRVLAMRADVARPPPGSFYVVPDRDGAIRLEEVR